MKMNRKEHFFQTLYCAAEQSFSALFRDRPEHYYYAALIMMDTGAPCITAMSEETLSRLDPERRWSYGDSPYTGYADKICFQDVNALFQQDVWSKELDDKTFQRRVADWQNIMVKVMQSLSENGVFDAYPDLFRNAESYPPEGDFNWENAQKLNSPAVFQKWFADNPDIEEEPQISEMWEVWHPTMCSVTLTKPLPSKTLAIALRKAFASPLSMSEFLRGCETPPFEISAEFRHREAKEILSAHPEYAGFLSVQILPQKTEAIPY
jgi:hypothetical protein